MTREELINIYIKDKDISNYVNYQKEVSKIAYKLNKEGKRKMLPITYINSNEVLIISDTHFGSEKENYKYIDLVYDYAINNNINNILHTGDFMQGTIKPVISSCQIIENQILYVLDNYPYDKSINNYILIGNHDYFIFRKDENIIYYFAERKDLNFLGYRKVYLNWNNNLISLSHELKKHKIDVPRLETLVCFVGHRHELHIENNTIYVPTLSDDIKYYDNNFDNCPGFLKACIDDDNLNVYKYDINNNEISNKKLVLERKINERVKVQ